MYHILYTRVGVGQALQDTEKLLENTMNEKWALADEVQSLVSAHFSYLGSELL